MSRWLSWIFLTPVALVVIAFSASNRGTVVLNLWPLDVGSPPLPIFGVVFAGIFAGALLAGSVAWLTAGKLRRQIRNLTRRADNAEQEVTRLHQDIDDLKSSQKSRQVAIAPQSEARAA